MEARLFSGPSVPLAAILCSVLALAACAPVESDVALGTLERDRIVLTATADEIVTELPVAEGSLVQEGQLLAQLNADKQVLQVQVLETELAQADAVLQRLLNGPRAEDINAAQARVAMAKALLTESQKQSSRVQQLVDRGVTAQSELDTAIAARDSREASLQDARAQLELLLAGSRDEDIAEARARQQTVSTRLELERRRLQDLSIVATRSGILDSLPYHLGERVLAGTPVAVLLSDGPPYARVFIPESRRAAIRTGMSLTVRVDGVENTFTGTVRWIAMDPEFTPYYALNSQERARLVYRAEVELAQEASELPTGLPAQVELPL